MVVYLLRDVANLHDAAFGARCSPVARHEAFDPGLSGGVDERYLFEGVGDKDRADHDVDALENSDDVLKRPGEVPRHYFQATISEILHSGFPG